MAVHLCLYRGQICNWRLSMTPLQGTWVVANVATNRGHRVAAHSAVDCVPAMHGDGFGTLSVM